MRWMFKVYSSNDHDDDDMILQDGGKRRYVSNDMHLGAHCIGCTMAARPRGGERKDQLSATFGYSRLARDPVLQHQFHLMALKTK